jgi:choice-of-anchor B domain-containing protein
MKYFVLLFICTNATLIEHNVPTATTPMHLGLLEQHRKNKNSDESASVCGDYGAKGITKLGHISLSDMTVDNCADITGYVSPSGKEYAMIGCSPKGMNATTVTIVDVAEKQIVYQGGKRYSTWFDLKMYKQFLYVVTESTMVNYAWCPTLVTRAGGPDGCGMTAIDAWSVISSVARVKELCPLQCKTYDDILPKGPSICNAQDQTTCTSSHIHCHWNGTDCLQDFAPLMVFDLTNIDEGVVTEIELDETTFETETMRNTHNLAINEDTGFLYRTNTMSSTNVCTDHYSCATLVYDLKEDPKRPKLVASFGNRGHDIQVKNYKSGMYAGSEIVFQFEGYGPISIYNVTDKTNIKLLSQIDYPERQFSHQGWVAENGKYMYVNDELAYRSPSGLYINTTVFIFDVSNLNNPMYLKKYQNGPVGTSHNIYERDGLVYQANYLNGLNIYKTNEDSLREVAYYDSHIETDNDVFEGAWGAYPYLPSETILISDVTCGLYMFKYSDCESIKDEWRSQQCCDDYDDSCRAIRNEYKTASCCDTERQTPGPCFENRFVENKYGKACQQIAADGDCAVVEENLWPNGETSNQLACKTSCGYGQCSSTSLCLGFPDSCCACAEYVECAKQLNTATCQTAEARSCVSRCGIYIDPRVCTIPSTCDQSSSSSPPPPSTLPPSSSPSPPSILPPSPSPSNSVPLPESYQGTYSGNIGDDAATMTLDATSWTLGDGTADYSVSYDEASTSIYTITDTTYTPETIASDVTWGFLSNFVSPGAEFKLLYYIDFTGSNTFNIHFGVVWAADQNAADFQTLAVFFPVAANSLGHPAKWWEEGWITGPNAFTRD